MTKFTNYNKLNL